MIDIEKRVTKLRQERGWSKYMLAKRAGLCYTTIFTLSSRERTPRLQTLEQICDGLGITMSQFFADGDEAVQLTTMQQQLLTDWLSLRPENQQAVIDLIRFYQEKERQA